MDKINTLDARQEAEGIDIEYIIEPIEVERNNLLREAGY
jgi:hypothetical protein